MKITFVFASWSPAPSGGYRVIYKYADMLGNRGHEVFLIHPLWILPKESGLTGKLKEVLRWMRYNLGQNRNSFFLTRIFTRFGFLLRFTLFGKDRYLKLQVPPGKMERIMVVPTLCEKHIPEADAVFATDSRTANWVADYGINRGVKYYLIQDPEMWKSPKEETLLAWRLPLKKIVISNRLKEELSRMGTKAYGYVPNGIDFNEFCIKTPIETRNPNRIGMLYHSSPFKGSREGIEALRIVRTKCPELEAIFFSAFKRNREIPSWVEFYQTPLQERILEIYNSCSIFVSPSWSEGWCLTSAEAMACGCALASTKGGSVEEYAIDGETALLSENNDPLGLAENIIKLIDDQILRIRLARQGNNLIRQFTWEKSVAQLERILLNKNYTH